MKKCTGVDADKPIASIGKITQTASTSLERPKSEAASDNAMQPVNDMPGGWHYAAKRSCVYGRPDATTGALTGSGGSASSRGITGDADGREAIG